MDSRNISNTRGVEDLRKLKLGLRIETRKWRAEASKLMGGETRGVNKKYDFNSDEKIDEKNGRFRPLNKLKIDDDTEDIYSNKQNRKANNNDNNNNNNNNNRDGKGYKEKEKNNLISSNASGKKWKLSLDLINNANKKNKNKIKNKSADNSLIIDNNDNRKNEREVVKNRIGETYNIGEPDDRGLMENMKSLVMGKKKIEKNEKNMVEESVDIVEDSLISPNYALLIHSCLMLSLSTYNLKVNVASFCVCLCVCASVCVLNCIYMCVCGFL